MGGEEGSSVKLSLVQLQSSMVKFVTEFIVSISFFISIHSAALVTPGLHWGNSADGDTGSHTVNSIQ